MSNEGAKFTRGLEGEHHQPSYQFCEVPKYFSVPEGVHIYEPSISESPLPFSPNGLLKEPDTVPDLAEVKFEFKEQMEAVAPDLQSNNLASIYSDSVFETLKADGAQTYSELIYAGMERWHAVGRDVLGPIAVSFVDTALLQSEGVVNFPARDATPFFYVAKTLTMLNPGRYPVATDNIQNPGFNRKTWGIDDEQDQGKVLSVSDPIVQKALVQMGFGTGRGQTFIEVGCWGSMVDQLKSAMEKGKMTEEDFNVRFFFTHLPDHIYGYTNLQGDDIPESVLETLADTWEAFPKSFTRSTDLVEEDGVVKAHLSEDSIVDSPFLHAWSLAGLQGVVDAARLFVENGSLQVDPRAEVFRLWELSNAAQDGTFTGVLPGHTETWTEGAQWIKDWRWGKIAPLV